MKNTPKNIIPFFSVLIKSPLLKNVHLNPFLTSGASCSGTILKVMTQVSFCGNLAGKKPVLSKKGNQFLPIRA